MFNRDLLEFSRINYAVDVLLSRVKISIDPMSIEMVGETCLQQSIFGTSLFCVQTNNDLLIESQIVCRAMKIEPKLDD